MMSCDSENCKNIVYSGSFCTTCAQRNRRGYDKLEPNLSGMGVCSVSHCSKEANSRAEGALCDPHYQLKWRKIDPETRILRKNGDTRADKKCWVSECPKRATIHSLCGYHNGRASRGSLEVPDELGVKKNPPCLFEGCQFLQSCKGLCHGHYTQSRDGRELSPLRGWGKYIKGGHSCEVEGCSKSAITVGLCGKHHSISKRYRIDVATMSRLSNTVECENVGCTNTTKLHIDHDHATGEVRGMLCSSCNTSLGFLQEDLKRMFGLIEYKKLHG